MSTLHWLWDRLDVVTGVFLIPWGMFLISAILVGWRKLTETSGSDVYIILSSLDLEFLVFRGRFENFVYAGVRSKFSEVFAVGLVVSLAFLMFSSRAQVWIAEHHNSPEVSYPATSVIVCWAFALGWMALHFFAILSR